MDNFKKRNLLPGAVYNDFTETSTERLFPLDLVRNQYCGPPRVHDRNRDARLLNRRALCRMAGCVVFGPDADAAALPVAVFVESEARVRTP